MHYVHKTIIHSHSRMKIVNYDVLFSVPLVPLFFVIECSLFVCMHYSPVFVP